MKAKKIMKTINLELYSSLKYYEDQIKKEFSNK
jgi:hypothetical protein